MCLFHLFFAGGSDLFSDFALSISLSALQNGRGRTHDADRRRVLLRRPDSLLPKRLLEAPFAVGKTARRDGRMIRPSVPSSVRPRPSVVAGVAKVIKAAAALRTGSLLASQSGHPSIRASRTSPRGNFKQVSFFAPGKVQLLSTDTYAGKYVG